jgi:PAS domain S-box-containing protein
MAEDSFGAAPQYTARTNGRGFDRGAASREQSPGGIAHETGELHRLLVESVDDYAIFALDPDGYILSWNAGAQRFKGYTASEIIGKHFSIFYPREKVLEGFPEYELREAARVGRFEDEGWRIRKDGTRFWANVVITALRDSSGQLVGYAKVTRDLTERRMAEEELRESEERFRLLVNSVKDYAIFMLDPTGHITTWNEGAQRIKGYSADEIIGKHFSIFYPPEVAAVGHPQHELEIAEKEGVYEEEGWRVRKDGSKFWANVVITAVRRADGSLAGFAKVTRDLTERRNAEERALESARQVAAEETARAIAESNRARTETLQKLTAALSAAHTIPEITDVVFTQGLREVGADAAALGVVDQSGEKIRVLADHGFGKMPAWARIISMADDLPMTRVIRTGRPVVLRSKAERDRLFPKLRDLLDPFSASAVWPLMGRGRSVGALSIHTNRELDQSSLEFMQAFAQQVAQALERATLYQAEQDARTRADEANQAKSAFLAAMSHELRTPLNAIGGYADLVAMGVRGPVTEEQREDLERIKRSQKHLLGIINDILNFSRVEAGQATYQCSPVPLHEVITGVGHMVEPQAKAKGLTLEALDCPPDVIAWADKSKVEQILLNLLSNAVKFTNEGKITVECTFDSNEHVDITVVDSGVGIEQDQLEQIFEPFVQVGRSLTQAHEGTGLGLAISRDLARAMNGDVTVTSEVGKGSRFTLELPRYDERQPGRGGKEQRK